MNSFIFERNYQIISENKKSVIIETRSAMFKEVMRQLQKNDNNSDECIGDKLGQEDFKIKNLNILILRMKAIVAIRIYTLSTRVNIRIKNHHEDLKKEKMKIKYQ